MLDTEIRLFEQQLPELLKEHEGRFVVIKGDSIVSFFDTIEDALAEGARRFGLQPFLARRIEESQPLVSVPALAFGLISADPPHTVLGKAPEA